MTVMRVKTDGLNLRSAPKVTPGNIRASLPLAHPVEVLDIAPGEEFARVRTRVNGATDEGFVALRFLREPLSDAREALLEAAVRQWVRFERGGGKENAEPFFRFVGQFWQALGPDFSGLNGRDRGIPWSAAFISFVVRETGAYPSFPFAAAHARYIVDAKRRREANDAAAPFWLFRLGEHRPQLGDLVCRHRQAGVSFDALPEDGFASHTDIVVEVRDRTIRTLGGNVSDSVSVSTYSLTDGGFVKPEGRLFAIMRNNK